MPLPTMSLRAAPEHHGIIREIAAALRSRPDLLPALRALLSGPSDAAIGGAAGEMADLRARLAAVERWIAERDGSQAAPVREELRSPRNLLPPGTTFPPDKSDEAATRSAIRSAPALRGQMDIEDLCGAPPHRGEGADFAPVQISHPSDPDGGKGAKGAKGATDCALSTPDASASASGPGFGARVRAARKERALSQEALGKLIGVTGSAIGLIEGGGGLKPETRAKLAEVLGL